MKPSECEGRDYEAPELPYGVAIDILNKLDAMADDQEAFVRVGAFDAFKDGRPKAETIEIGERTCRIWNYDRQVIVAIRKCGEKATQWSRFARDEDGEWSDGEWFSVSWGELFGLMREYPTVTEKLMSIPIRSAE